MEPCGTRALGGGASASLQSFAARCSVRLSCLLQNASAHASRSDSAARGVHETTRDAVRRASARGRREPAVASRRVPRADHDDHDRAGAAHDDDDAHRRPRRRRRRHRRPRRRRRHRHRRPPTTTTTTTAPPRRRGGEQRGRRGHVVLGGAASGMCASPTLPFGTVLTVVNNATGASTDVHGGRPRGGRATRGWSTCRPRASRRSPTSAREWWTSQSPGDPFRRRHRPAAVGARAAPEPGPRAELRR